MLLILLLRVNLMLLFFLLLILFEWTINPLNFISLVIVILSANVMGDLLILLMFVLLIFHCILFIWDLIMCLINLEDIIIANLFLFQLVFTFIIIQLIVILLIIKIYHERIIFITLGLLILFFLFLKLLHVQFELFFLFHELPLVFKVTLLN